MLRMVIVVRTEGAIPYLLNSRTFSMICDVWDKQRIWRQTCSDDAHKKKRERDAHDGYTNIGFYWFIWLCPLLIHALHRSGKDLKIMDLFSGS